MYFKSRRWESLLWTLHLIYRSRFDRVVTAKKYFWDERYAQGYKDAMEGNPEQERLFPEITEQDAYGYKF